MERTCITVRQLNMYIKSLLDGDVRLNAVCVMGEISNFKHYGVSGHCYFTLKDESAAVKCVMFKSFYERSNAELKDGLAVICFGRVTAYEKDGVYELFVESVKEQGSGQIAENIRKLKEKLLKEGLFDTAAKKQLPAFPKKIALITSSSGAVMHDVINVVSRRWPIAEIVVAKASVQGNNAEKELVSALDRVYRQSDIDLIIIGRGGGSSEDLSVFNSEPLARKIYISKIPVISAVGHETDFTVCDLVADMRAPTPSAAAELAVPDINEITQKISDGKRKIRAGVYNTLGMYEARFKAVKNLSVISHPEYFTEKVQENILKLTAKISDLAENKIKDCSNKLAEYLYKIDAMNPLKVLARGYTVASKNGKVLTTVTNVEKGEKIKVKFVDGSVICTADEVQNGV